MSSRMWNVYNLVLIITDIDKRKRQHCNFIRTEKSPVCRLLVTSVYKSRPLQSLSCRATIIVKYSFLLAMIAASLPQIFFLVAL